MHTFWKAFWWSAGGLAGVIVLLLVVSFILGQPISYKNDGIHISINAFKQELNGECVQQLSCPEVVGFSQAREAKSATNAISISSIKPELGTYFTGQNATIRFEIDNPLNFSYQVIANWLHENSLSGSRIFEGNGTRPSWYVTNNMSRQGDWSVYIVVTWLYEGQLYQTGDTTHFRVLIA